jgi:hypothetical protein
MLTLAWILRARIAVKAVFVKPQRACGPFEVVPVLTRRDLHRATQLPHQGASAESEMVQHLANRIPRDDRLELDSPPGLEADEDGVDRGQEVVIGGFFAVRGRRGSTWAPTASDKGYHTNQPRRCQYRLVDAGASSQ